MPPDAGPTTLTSTPLDFAGRDIPYPEKVPVCKNEQVLKRALLVRNPDKQTYKAVSIDPNRHPFEFGHTDWRDPADQDVETLEKFLKAAKATGLCQGRLPQNPSRIGLFWIMAKDPLRELDKIPHGKDVESQMKTHKEVKNLLSGKLQRCVMPEAKYKYAIQNALVLNEMALKHEREKTDPLALRAAPIVADKVVSKARLADVTEDGQAVLENVIAFGLDRGLVNQDFFDIASQLGKISNSSEQFIYGFMTLISLRVARSMNRISPDVDDFTRKVESAILDDRIHIRVMTAGDIARSPGAGALYDPKIRNIVFPPVGKTFSVRSMFQTIIHESYHAYQHILTKPLSVSDLEFQANERGTRAAALLDMGALYYPEQLVKEQHEAIREHGKLLAGMKRESLKCQGDSDAEIADYEKSNAEIERLGAEWNDAVNLEVQGLKTGSLSPIFRAYYREVNWDSISASVFMQNLLATGAHIESYSDETSTAAEERYQLENKYLNDLIKKVNAEKAGTFERGRVAYIFVHELLRIASIAYYLDVPRLIELRTAFVNERELLAEALLDMRAR